MSEEQEKTEVAYDDLYLYAVRIVLRRGEGSVSMLQECLAIGYNQACRLIELLAANRLISQYTGCGYDTVRQANLTLDEYHRLTGAVFDLRDACEAAVELCVDELGPVHRARVCKALEEAIAKAEVK